MREVISGQFPAVFILENIFQVFAVQHYSPAWPSPEFRLRVPWSNKLALGVEASLSVSETHF